MAYISDKKWNNITKWVYTKWYEKSIPKCDYDELVASAFETDEDGMCPGTNENHVRKLVFEAYYITPEDFDSVYDEAKKEFNLTKSQAHDLGWLALGHGPTHIPELTDDEMVKFNKLIEKVNNQELIKPEDLFHTQFDGNELNERDILRLYEYNRRSHPEEAAKYFEMLKNM